MKATKLTKQAANHKKDTEMALETKDADAGGDLIVPEITLRIQVPKIPGLDTSHLLISRLALEGHQ